MMSSEQLSHLGNPIEKGSETEGYDGSRAMQASNHMVIFRRSIRGEEQVRLVDFRKYRSEVLFCNELKGAPLQAGPLDMRMVGIFMNHAVQKNFHDSASSSMSDGQKL